MESYEYLVVPAPRKGAKAKGLKSPADRYAHQMTLLLNDLAAEGWEYWRADSLASEERKGLMGTTNVSHELLIFRRLSAAALATQMPTQGYATEQTEPARNSPLAAPDTAAAHRAEPSLGRPDTAYPENNGPRLTAYRQD
ncbi:MAG: hypothetical protein HLUCCA05_13655 [Roseibaca calidilacus]|uniref:DUF4177 domain-containing protein n=1 Tax=Roseibaca calidilacus TaxID=1666912 RepID=A0A0P7WT62_9RHOB|nr:DUF4177 domain-containing protein [Roseibaca calidilacus]KPP90516.1 MAG: hypothetical protein HLUCCA05_13655 [Roseibaca calidilacus]CUX83345.1 hypothetical protein Ga0058931_2925 [Roseibaca calidilacus]